MKRLCIEVTKQIASDIKNFWSTWGILVLYTMVCSSVLLISLMFVVSFTDTSTAQGRLEGALWFLGTVVVNAVGSFWLWSAGNRARKKIKEENYELLKQLKTGPDTTNTDKFIKSYTKKKVIK